MLKEIVINVQEEETRVAVLEDRVLMEVYIERSQNQRLVGNIFKGKVENVLPGMQAAFVDIGLEKNAFLYVEDAQPSRHPEAAHQTGLHVNIGDILKQGQEIIVQIVKEPIGTKGPRVTTHITLPGRYLVLMPTVDYIGISRRIESEKERERLKELAARVKPEGMGVIVRTVAEGVEEEEFRQDILLLSKLWRKIQNRAANTAAPNLLHRDLELVQRMLRDIFSEDVDRLTLDSRSEYEKTLEILDMINPRLKQKVFLDERENIFEDYGIAVELEKALKRKVWLKCGAYLVIDQAEALTAIDVNTGKYVGSTTLEDTVLKTNLDAAVEIARQLRLRNIGGIIIVDFIDMAEEEHRQQVLATLEEEIKKDKTKTNILGITQLGLVEMTRKKVRPSLAEVVQKPCPYCEGRGKVLSEETVSIQLKSQIYQLARQTAAETILVEANPVVAARLIGAGGVNLRELEHKTGKNLYIRGSATHHLEQVSIKPLSEQEEISSQTVPVKAGEIIELKVEEPHISNPSDGIARLEGFIIDVEGGGALVGEVVTVEIVKVHRTYAKARLI
ncbi:Rne/Rng family ribonuclease [Desulforamulus hydrothermalis]|uniref:Ribonuclease G n=1 Tax=Desulforamulus hydrothermalis Lam5 = DSM 18033 TaxID=1121428 RepID=K8DY63_9FIRM|nr:Rne/Rng family ribonuclease [Desulforamulus hydrothermalis]CCO07689.1 Ribonuclease G [Desulforamulus hydrothermalis Lam5 = DSM 18033]SHH25397.1 RNAse G [Desulforamulus hydrothermalis Lam5 = DSM 18033]